MPWRPITVQNITSRLTVSEAAMLANASGAASALQTRLTDAIAMFDSAMIATGFNVAAPPNMVDSLRQDVMNYSLWDWLLNFPLLAQFKTAERKAAYDRACDKLKAVANRLAGAIEDPNGYRTTGNWNSNQRLLGRMWPTPPPWSQIEIQSSPYPQEANQTATSGVVQDNVPDAPKNLIVTQSTVAAGQLVLYWIQPSNGFTYSVFKGTASGAENSTPIATGIYGNTYTDAAVTIGTPYWYYVTATNEVGNSQPSNESTNTPIATIAPVSPFAPYYFV